MFLRALLALIASTLVVPVPATTTPQPDRFGRLADRQFLVHTPRGSGYALYFANGSLDGSADATRAIIVVHGVLRDADYYYDTGIIAAAAAHELDRTLVIAPQFVEARDIAGHHLPSNTLRWTGKWPGGSDAVAPAPISTYDVFDAIIARLSEKRLFPSLHDVVLVGHSAGGQIVQRYAIVGNAAPLDPGSRLPVRLIVSNPSSYLYFTDWRPFPPANCPDFDRWRYGLAGAPRYVSGSAAALERRYVKRKVTYLMGEADTNAREEDLDRSCGGEAQGPFRFARAKYFIDYIANRHPAGTSQHFAFVPGVGHDNRGMFTSRCGLGVIFAGTLQRCRDAGPVGGKRQ
jgi:pimeloyl-ACP methyl ester carboxylesterase